MGKTSTSTQSSGTQSQTVTPTKEERELNKLQLSREKFLDPYIRQSQQSGLNLSNLLLTGSNLPGYLSEIPKGISPEITDSIVNQSLKDLNVQLAASGGGTFLESGASQAIGGRTAGDIRTQAAQFNLQNLGNLLNLGVGGQYAAQQAPLGYSGQLSQRLAGLRSTTGTYNSSQTSTQNQGWFNSFMDFYKTSSGAAAQAYGGGCWVASELFGGWFKPETILARFYVNELAPKWFKSIYLKFGERIASFIKDKPVLKAIFRPLFKNFGKISEDYLNGKR